MVSKVNELFELVFEGLTEEDALRIAEKLLQRSIGSQMTVDNTLDVELPKLAISDQLEIERPHVRVLCYGESIYDVEINFVICDVKPLALSRLAPALQAFAINLTEGISSPSFFAGLDPACDQDTRIFTGTKLGPLFLHDDESH